MKTEDEDYTCPHCGYEMPEDESEQTCDCGCLSCRHIIDWEESEYLRYATKTNIGEQK